METATPLPESSSCEEWRQLHRSVEATPSIDSRELVLDAFQSTVAGFQALKEAEELRFYREGGPDKVDLLQHRRFTVELLQQAEGLYVPLILMGLADELVQLKTIQDALQESLNLWHPVNPLQESERKAIASLFE